VYNKTEESIQCLKIVFNEISYHLETKAYECLADAEAMGHCDFEVYGIYKCILKVDGCGRRSISEWGLNGIEGKEQCCQRTASNRTEPNHSRIRFDRPWIDSIRPAKELGSVRFDSVPHCEQLIRFGSIESNRTEPNQRSIRSIRSIRSAALYFCFISQ
jgi:hypothetical protein